MPELLRKLREMAAPSICAFWMEEAGQDLIEYSLLMAFVALSSAALFISSGNSVSKVWSSSNSALSTAAVKAAS